MSQKPETIFRQKFRAKLEKIPNCWWESIQQKTIGGTPDLIGCVAGFFVALELKARDVDHPSPLQRLKLDRIASAGGMGLVVSPGTAAHALELIEHLSRREEC